MGRKLHASVMVATTLCAAAAFAANVDDAQVNEAAAVFDGVKPGEMRGGTWKVVYSSAEGPQGRALETLTERLGPYFLREGHIATAMVLPLEREFGDRPHERLILQGFRGVCPR